MFHTRTDVKISTRLFLALGALFIIAGTLFVVLINTGMRKQALAEAHAKARVLLDRNLATHTYFTHQLKPKLFELTAGLVPKEYFDPVWMSSTYAVREIDKYFKTLNPSDYYYKECAINARSPENEADAYERAFLKEMGKNSTLVERSAVRILQGKPFFTILRKGETLGNTCMRCHSAPEKAPVGLVQRYDQERSFHRREGDIVSAISIRIPLTAAYSTANRFTLIFSTLLIMVLGSLFALMIWLNNRLVFAPLRELREKVQQISTASEHLGEEISMPSGRELQDLTVAFNAMSFNLRHIMDYLENRVEERTAALEETNDQLTQEIEERERMEEALQQEKDRLLKALAEVKALSGLLPICASCKKIRDDKGYWNQIEAYIQDHSEAEFSHSLCPECAKKLYPDYSGYK